MNLFMTSWFFLIFQYTYLIVARIGTLMPLDFRQRVLDFYALKISKDAAR